MSVGIRRFAVVIRGLSPILFHRNSPEMEELLAKARNNEAKQKIEEENYELYLYLDGGKPYIPALMLQRCLVEAAKNFQERGRGKKSYKNVVGGGLVAIAEEKIPIATRSGWKPNKMYVRVQNNRVLRCRPQIDDWAAEFTLLIDGSIDYNVIRNIVEYAGIYCGLGDFRPQKGGPFGRFKVEKFEEVKK